ncbi:unnamed protein product [Gongylonema pulchrum]|uniref:Uncharacterized protein n=1 Tax=Gongylonema pulchrum TaxID=637853 RepID=A0A183DYQ1_9BILA|nr:unnamed protein product [Gongylonema pulchrum]
MMTMTQITAVMTVDRPLESVLDQVADNRKTHIQSICKRLWHRHSKWTGRPMDEEQMEVNKEEEEEEGQEKDK